MNSALRRATIVITLVATVSSAIQVATSTAATATPGSPRMRHETRMKPVPGHPAPRVSPAHSTPGSGTPVRGRAPAPESVSVTLPDTGSWKPIGSSGLSAAQVSGGAVTTAIQVLDLSTVAHLGLAGIVLRLRPTGTSRGQHTIAVGVPTELLNGLYGADYAARIQWQQVTDCVTASACGDRHTLASKAVATAHNLPVRPGPSLDSAPRPATTDNGEIVARATLSTKPVLLVAAASANASNGSGSFSATSLSPSSQWQASPQTGAFTWDYPLRTPPAAAGPTPDLSISYDSTSVNGHTGSTNNQPSQIGEGFDLSGGGYIERSFVPCNTDGQSTSADECWKTDTASLAMSGHSGELVKNSSGTWKLANDDNTKVEHLTNDTTYCSNGTYDNDCWRLTTADGTKYYFGRNKLSGWTSASQSTNSAWTVPVYGNNSGEPCYHINGTDFAHSRCVQAWRWNLDYVVDPHNNSKAFYYTPETNNYAINNSTVTSASYTRGGYLTHIDYGMHVGYELTQKAPDQVTVAYGERCQTGISGEPANACSTEPPTTSNAVYWRDVPWDQYCNATTCSGKPAPTFWTAKRITAIGTQYWNGTAYVAVDSWGLTHSWPDPHDGSSAALTLATIAHSGKVADTIALPTTTFGYTMLPSRVAPPNGIVPLEKSRLARIDTETGAEISINYLPSDCSGTSPATPQTNTKRCFPQYWAPPGGSLALDWFNIYPVSSVLSDPMTGGARDTVDQTNYDYSIGTPAWRFDTSPLVPDGHRTWSVFAGYNKVRVKHGEPSSPSTLETTDYTYLRGMNGDLADTTGAKRSVTVTSADATTVTDSPWWAGRTLETIVYNGLGGPAISDTVTQPWASAPTVTGAGITEHIGTGATTFTYTPTARHTDDSVTVSHTLLSTGGARTIQQNNTFDSYGRAIKAEDLGDTAISSDDRCTVTTFADNTSTWRLSYPDEINTYAGTCATLPADPKSATVSDVRTSYDSQAWGIAPTVGDVTQTQQASDYTGTTPTWLTTTTTTYDALGRPLTTKDALQRLNQTAYLPAAPAAAGSVTSNIGPLTQTTATDPMGFTTVDTYNQAWGAVTTETDVNEHVTTATFDALGRRTAVWLPDRPKATNPTPSIGYAYTVTNTAPVTVATTALTPTGATMTSYELYDGLLRSRQSQEPAEAATYNAPPGTGGAAVTDTLYDAAGRVVTTTNPYPISPAPSATLWVPTSEDQVPGATQVVYDGAGHTTATLTLQYAVEQWRTSYAYPGNSSDRVDTTPPAGGTPTTTYTDGRGNTTDLLQYHGASIGDPSDPSQFDKTHYTYDPTGPMHSMTDQAGEQWSWTYDVLGRQTTATDPDSGTTHNTYDNDDELQSTTDADGTPLWYSYDNDGRKTAVNQDSSTGPLLDSWAYDSLPNAKGLLIQSTSYDGSTAGSPGIAYTTAVTGYDAANRPLGTATTLPADTLGAGSASYTYTTTTTYNPDGSPATQALPAAGTLPAETLHYTYTSLGRPYSLIGRNEYLFSTAYDQVGKVGAVNRYNGAHRLKDVYTYTSGTSRLINSQTTTAAPTDNIAASTTYTYDDAGDITSATNTPSALPADTQCFNYDYLQRLQQAWTPTNAPCTTEPSTADIGGPAPYWQSYTYTSNGNRVSLTKHATTPTGTDQRDTYTYPTGSNPDQPHAVTQIEHADAPADSSSYTPTGTDAYSYNSDGQLTTAPGEQLSWTPQGQLSTIERPNGQTQKRIYDPTGNLLVQTDPDNGTVVYLGDTELKVAAGSTTVTGQRSYTALGQTVAVRTGTTTTTITWLSTDSQGTAEIAESFDANTTTTRTFDPFGNPRGTTTDWPTERAFLNAPADAYTKLDHLGARDYDPATGRFITVDPVFDPTDPQQDNGYSYALNNPATSADPSGLCVHADGLSCGQTCGGTCGAPQSRTSPRPPANRPRIDDGGSGPGGALRPGDQKPRGGDRTTAHNNARDAAIRTIQEVVGEENAKNVHKEFRVINGSKNGSGRVGRADIVYVDSENETIWVWEVKSAGAIKGAEKDVRHYVSRITRMIEATQYDGWDVRAGDQYPRNLPPTSAPGKPGTPTNDVTFEGRGGVRYAPNPEGGPFSVDDGGAGGRGVSVGGMDMAGGLERPR